MAARLAWVLVLVLSLLAGCRPGAQLDRRLTGGVVTLEAAPPAISGGSLTVLSDGVTAIVADPDRDRVVVVDLPSRSVRREIAFAPGAQPGRVAEDASGRVHVVLRGSGDLASFEPDGDPVLRHACGMPRGVAYDGGTDEVLVACRGGELVTFAPASGPAVSTTWIADDLRDVLVVSGRRFVTTFRFAQLLELRANVIVSVRTPRDVVIMGGDQDQYSASVAWRTIVVPGTTTIAMVHQRGRTNSIAVHQAAAGAPHAATGYGGPSSSVVTCRSSVVHGAVTLFDLDGPVRGGGAIPMAVLPVDLAVHEGRFAIAAAGNQAGSQSIIQATDAQLGDRDDGCARVDDRSTAQVPTAVAFDGEGALVVLEREPATLVIGGDRIALGGASVFDTGQALFHGNAGESIACASCHPEGGEDGRTWTFDGVARRTQSISGGVLATAPFHWNGEHASFDTLVVDVFETRMRGPTLSSDETSAFASWIDTLPAAVPSVSDPAAVARGAAIFAGPADCASCHSGAHFTNGETIDVGLGTAFQVPALNGVSHRLPLMHDGCARTLEERFEPRCGGDHHGNFDGLDEAERADLLAFLRSI